MRSSFVSLVVLVLVGFGSLVVFGQSPRPTSRPFVYYDMIFAYPAELSLIPPKGQTGGPITFTNFDGNYGHGGIVPRNGVDVTFSRRSKEGKSLAEIIADQTKGDQRIFSSSTQFNGNLAFKVVTDIDFGVFKMRRIAVYFDRGDIYIYQIFADFYPDDPNAKTTESLVDGMLSTVRFR